MPGPNKPNMPNKPNKKEMTLIEEIIDILMKLLGKDSKNDNSTGYNPGSGAVGKPIHQINAGDVVSFADGAGVKVGMANLALGNKNARALFQQRVGAELANNPAALAKSKELLKSEHPPLKDLMTKNQNITAAIEGACKHADQLIKQRTANLSPAANTRSPNQATSETTTKAVEETEALDNRFAQEQKRDNRELAEEAQQKQTQDPDPDSNKMHSGHS